MHGYSTLTFKVYNKAKNITAPFFYVIIRFQSYIIILFFLKYSYIIQIKGSLNQLLKSHFIFFSPAPPCGSDGSDSPAGVVFMLGSPEYGHTPPHARHRRFSGDTSIILLNEIETQVFCLHGIVSVAFVFNLFFVLLKWVHLALPVLAGPMALLKACAMVTQIPWQQTCTRM